MATFEELYEELKAADLIVGSYETDLYALDCAATTEILERYPIAKAISVRFREYRNHPGSRWLWEIPFANVKRRARDAYFHFKNRVRV